MPHLIAFQIIFYSSINETTTSASSSSSPTTSLSLDEESDSDEYHESDETDVFTKKKGKKKTGRKTQWSGSLLSDMIDVIVSSENYKRKLIFTNTKNQKNGEIYGKVLDELKIRASSREENVPFTAVQLRNKFKNVLQSAKKLH